MCENDDRKLKLKRLLQLALPQLRNDGFNAFPVSCYLNPRYLQPAFCSLHSGLGNDGRKKR